MRLCSILYASPARPPFERADKPVRWCAVVLAVVKHAFVRRLLCAACVQQRAPTRCQQPMAADLAAASSIARARLRHTAANRSRSRADLSVWSWLLSTLSRPRTATPPRLGVPRHLLKRCDDSLVRGPLGSRLRWCVKGAMIGPGGRELAHAVGRQLQRRSPLARICSDLGSRHLSLRCQADSSRSRSARPTCWVRQPPSVGSLALIGTTRPSEREREKYGMRRDPGNKGKVMWRNRW